MTMSIEIRESSKGKTPLAAVLPKDTADVSLSLSAFDP